jgi:hypothetical protein
MYCKLYVSKIESFENLIEILRLSFEFSVQGRELSMSFGEISILENSDYDIEKEKEYPDGFLFFTFLLEVEIDENYSIEDCVKIIDSILHALWSKDITAIASCDLEYLLDEKGGYNSLNIPWPAIV